MPVYEIELDDGRKFHIDADSHDDAIAGLHAHLNGQQGADKAPASPDAPSGVVAGFKQGVSNYLGGHAATAEALGADAPSLDKAAQNVAPQGYVPANPLHPSEWMQYVAEHAPGLTQDILAARAGAALGSKAGPRGALVGGLAGGLGSAAERMLGSEAKQFATERTGDKNAKPDASDLTKAALASGAEGLASAIPVTRFVPGLSSAVGVGVKGLGQAALKYLTTAGSGAVGSGASSAIDQLAHKGTVDPEQTLKDTVGGAVVSGAFGAPRGAADAAHAVRYREFGGENADAAAAYGKRLSDNAGDAGLGNAKRDFAAQESTKKNLKNELQDVSDAGMSQDEVNALALARTGSPLTNDHVSTIEQADPAAGFLARQLRMAQLAEKFGSYDTSNERWSGGVSGAADKYAVRPFKTHLLIGSAAAALGAHSLGTYGLPFLGAAAAGYGGARLVDGLTGARSPANSFVKNFADLNAATRLPAAPSAPPPPAPGPAQPWGPVPPGAGPTGPRVAPPAAPQPVRPSPWGPRPPMAGPTGPQVTPPAAPAPPTPGTLPWKAPQVTQLPQFNPMALAMMQKKIKVGLPPEPAPAPAPAPAHGPAPAPQPTAPWSKPQVTELPQFSPTALSMLKAKLKAGLPPTPPPAPAANTVPTASLSSPSAPAAPAAPVQSIADILSNLNAPEPKKITKGDDGEVKSNFYRPLSGDELKYTHETPLADIASNEASTRMADKPDIVQENYRRRVLDTHTERRQIVENLIGLDTSPDETAALKGLIDQLHNRSDKASASQAIEHTAGLLSPQTAAKLRKGFNEEALSRIWDKPKKKSIGTTKKRRNARKEKGDAEVQAVAER